MEGRVADTSFRNLSLTSRWYLCEILLLAGSVRSSGEDKCEELVQHFSGSSATDRESNQTTLDRDIRRLTSNH